MGGWKSALAAAVAALALAGCGDDEAPPFKTVSQPASTSTASPTSTFEIDSKPPVDEMVAKLRGGTRAKLAPVAGAWATLDKREDDVVRAAEEVQQIVEQIGTGNAAPGGSAPELAKLSEALGSFADAFAPLAEAMLPQLSGELDARARQLRPSPARAAKLLAAKGAVDAAIGLMPRLERELADARTSVRKQQEDESLDAEDLHESVTAAREATAAAVAASADALARGLSALGAAA